MILLTIFIQFMYSIGMVSYAVKFITGRSYFRIWADLVKHNLYSIDSNTDGVYY